MFRKVFLLVMSLLISLPGAGLANTGSQSSTSSDLQANTSKLVNSEETANSLEYTDDYTGPVLETATITPKEAAAGDTVTITAKVTDDQSGVGSVQAIFYGNTDKTVDLAYNSETGDWSGTYKIADYDHEGTWYLSFDMYDNAGNYSYGDTNESINVTNPNGDFDPAVIEKVTIDPQPVQAGEQVNVTAKITDDMGIQSVKGDLFNPEGYYEGEVNFTYDSTADEWKGSSTIGANAYPGDWTLDVNVIDKAGNYTYNSTTFQVSNENGDFTAPVIGDVTINKQVVNPDDELTVKANISDDKSGVDYAYTELCSNDECYGYDLVQNPSTGLWETTISIPGYFKPGTYEIQIQASDKAGNYEAKTLDQTLEVHNDGDYTPPVVEDFQISTLTAKPNEEITFTAAITDDQSEVGEVEVYLNSPSGQFRWLSLNYDDALGKWVGTYKVQPNDEPGTWTVEDRVSDVAGNGTWNNHGEITIENPDGDFAAPALDSFEVSPASVKVGETLTFKAKVSDAQSEVAQVFVDLYNTEFERGQQIDLTYDHTSGYWVGTYTVDKTDPNGSFELSVFFEDTVGNNDWGYPQQTVTIDNPDYDGTAPTFENIELSAAEVNFGEDLTITASIHDDNSGVREAYVYLISPSGEGRVVDLTYNAELDKWVGTFTIGSREESGQWAVNELNFFDNYGNGNWESIGKTFTVNNPNADFEAPVLDSAVITPETAKVGDKITVKIKAHDAKSGITNAYVFLYNPENEENKYITLDYNQTTDEWIGTYVVQYNDRPGTWTLSDIYLEDSVGNYAYTSSEASVKVENPNGDFAAPEISKIEVSPATIQVGEKVTITSDVTDDKSGVREVIASLSHPSGASQYITLRYNATTEKWTGSFEALETTAPGEWSINISASDQFGNYSDMTSDQPFTVVNPDGDYTGPVIQGVDINPTEVNAGDQVTFTATIDDDKSGVGWVQAYVSYLGELTFKKDSTSGKWVATATVPTNAPDNEEIMIYDLLAYDLKGNLTQQWVGQSIIVHNETGDYTAPVVDSIEITPAEVTAGEKLQIKAKITDAESGVKQVTGYFGNEYENRAVDFSYDEASGMWVADYTTSVNERPGTWDLNLEVWDNNENSDFIRTDKYVTINNPNADVTAPVIEAVEITPSTANVGDVVTISADVKDNESGVRYVKAYLNPAAGNRYNQVYVPLTYNEERNKWVGTYKISDTVQDGLWNVDVMAVDNYANSDYYSGGTFQVNNPDGDFEAPYLDSLKVSSSTANVGDTVTFEAKIADSKSGVKSASIRLGLAESNNDITVPLTYDKEKDVWSTSYQIPAYSRAGVQYISVMVEDNAGNQNDINPYQSLVILNDNPDKEAPVVGDITITPDQAAAGDTVKFKVKLDDSYSGVKNAAIELFYPDSAAAGEGNPDLRHIDLAYDANQKAWVGTYTINPTDNLGDWFVDVMAEDMAGNSTYVLSTKKLAIVKAAEGPAAPVVNEVTDKDTSVTGQAAAGLTVEVVANGSKLGSAEAGTDGKFTVAIPVQVSGTELTVTATDKAGKVSKATTVVVKDATAPAKPVVNEVTEKDTSVTGTAEAGSTVEVKANDTKLGSAEAGTDGKFTVAIPVQAAGTELTITATDKAGNVSEETKVAVKDTTAPEKPAVNEVTDKDTSVTGTAEASSVVEVKANGTKLGTKEAGTDGKFSVTIPVQKAGTELTITVTDKDGNVSEATTVVVKDVTPPALPVVNEVTEKDTAVTGTAEPGATIIVNLKGWTQNLGSGTVGADGKFAVAIPAQQKGTQLSISISDKAGNVGGEVTVTVSAAKLSGWVKDNKSWYYYDPATHVKKIGWFKDGVTWYYFNKDGVMQTGWQKIGTVWYYFNNGGAMQTGWLKLGTTWYFFNSGGAMVTGWLKSGATWYYFNTSGAMQIGWLKSGSSWYYFNGSGAMATGWVKISGKWYYFNSNGILK